MFPNILLVVFDTARADVFEPYGAPGGTPTMAQLASKGKAHPQAYASSSWTVPSHISLLSGLLPRQAGMTGRINSHPDVLRIMQRLGPRLLPRVLSAAGYRTFGISANGWVAPHSGFDIGFEDFRHIFAERHNRLGHGSLASRAKWAMEALTARLDDGAAEIATLVSEHVRQSRPFFGFVNLVECHSPYFPPRPFNSLGWTQRLRAVQDANRFCTFEAFWNQAFRISRVPDSSLDRMRTLYVSSIAQLDAWLARVLSALDEAKILDDTQVIVLSDHGENFGENGLTGHTFSLDDRLIHIPLVTAGPIELAAPRVVSLADLPRLLALAIGLADHPWTEPVRDELVAVAEFVAPADPEDPVAQSKVADARLSEGARHTLFRNFQCATDGSVKVIRDQAGDQLISLEDDPLETRPIAIDESRLQDPRVQMLRRALDAADAAAGATRFTDPGFKGSPDIEDDDRLAHQMRLLGYI